MCAIKEVKVIADDSNSKECLRQLNQEMLLLNQLSHPNIVQYYGSELSTETLSVYLEFVSGGSIHKLLQEYGPLGETVLRNYTAQILSGLAYLHGRKTVHRYWKVTKVHRIGWQSFPFIKLLVFVNSYGLKLTFLTEISKEQIYL
jgi:serine/threonine protein kinase